MAGFGYECGKFYVQGTDRDGLNEHRGSEMIRVQIRGTEMGRFSSEVQSGYDLAPRYWY